ncbi:hypothetical protein [Streptomyces sp. NBC_01803]|uniref:hypothetical protein n=1 Tax=Streptomyces sp. NBC_01803 TaxID=2975946 RepID=UPI002DDC8B52|nr:hypothetical protein [Streptomyces sp. NBC_01803]WSA44990.1 hypothetical protein OIE51_12670 [Streptomyces sp. NBC_01803]
MAPDERMIAALQRERAGYAARGLDDRVRQVDEQLAHYGYEPDPEDGPQGRTAPPQDTADATAVAAQPQETAEASAPAQVKRGRGRPRKPQTEAGPADAGSATGD